MKKTAVIVTEVTNRELDNAILLKMELVRRGYNVEIMNKWEQLRLKKTDVLIIPNCYNKDNYEYYRYRFNAKNDKIINLQYEQVLSPIEEDNELYSLDDTAKKVVHICWGRHTYDRLTRKGVAHERLPITGAIQLDIARPMFSSCRKSRAEIAKEFSLDESKKWILYISSFACAENSLISDVQRNCHEKDNVDVFASVTSRSQQETLNWFDSFLSQHEGYTLIYRPHPVELSSEPVNKMVEKYPEKFRCIQDYEIKQWLEVCDIPCTWLSTSIAESYFLGKNCLVFRPVVIQPEVDCVLYEGVNAATSYAECEEQILSYSSSISSFPISKELIEYYYEFNPVPAFVKIADVIENVKCGENAGDTFFADRANYLIKNHILLKLLVKKLYRTWYTITGIRLKSQKLRSRFFVEEWEKTVDNRSNSLENIRYKEEKYKRVIDC